MHFSYITSIIDIAILAIQAFLMFAAAALIFIKHSNGTHDRSKSLIFTFFFSAAIVATGELVIILRTNVFLDHYQMMLLQTIIMSGIIYFTLMCYLVEVLRPYWLNLKRLLILLSPWLILVGIALYMHFTNDGLTSIYSLSKLKKYITYPDVIVRIAITSSLFFYTLWLFYICCFTKRYHPTRPMIRITMITLLLMTITFFCSRGLQFFWAHMAHEALYITITVLILYVEHYERLHIPYEAVRTYYNPAVEVAPSTTQEVINHVSITLCNIMEDPKVWSDPDITRDDIAHLVGSNRTYVNQAAKLLGFESVTDMLHKRRIEYVCERLREEPNANLQEVFYDAGYQSRTTAWRHFTNIVGCSPTEFQEKNIHQEHIT